MLRINLLEYLEIEKDLTQFFSKINFCSENCIQNQISLYNFRGLKIKGRFGCCTEDKSLAKTEILTKAGIRELIADRNRKYGVNEEILKGCRYHNLETGCILKTHKTPVCLGYICESFKDYLKNELGIDYNSYNMIQNLEMLLNGGLNPEILRSQIIRYLKLIEQNSPKSL